MKPTFRSRAAVKQRVEHRPVDGQSGQVGLLILCFTTVALALIIGVVNVTTLQLARARVYDACDAAALDAADELSNTSAYRGGIGTSVPLSTPSVRLSAERYLGEIQRPAHVTDWVVTGATGATSGSRAHVELMATVQMPLLDSLVVAISGPVTVRVSSDAIARTEVR